MYFNLKEAGERIKELRKANNMTQAGAAEKLNVSREHISRIETGKEAASIDLYIDMAELYGCSLDYMLLGISFKRYQEDFRLNLVKAVMAGVDDVLSSAPVF